MNNVSVKVKRPEIEGYGQTNPAIHPADLPAKNETYTVGYKGIRRRVGPAHGNSTDTTRNRQATNRIPVASIGNSLRNLSHDPANNRRTAGKQRLFRR